jgi:hypothetical protein
MACLARGVKFGGNYNGISPKIEREDLLAILEMQRAQSWKKLR